MCFVQVPSVPLTISEFLSKLLESFFFASGPMIPPGVLVLVQPLEPL